MTLKETLQKLTGKNNEYKRQFQEEQVQRKIQRILNEREKNANERELERYIEEERQRKIKMALDGYRKKHQREFWHTNSINKGWDVLKDDRPILKQKCIFKMSKTTMLHRGGIR